MIILIRIPKTTLMGINIECRVGIRIGGRIWIESRTTVMNIEMMIIEDIVTNIMIGIMIRVE